MNKYSRVFHHITIEDVKRNKREQMLVEKIKEFKEEEEIIESVKYVDWRSELKESDWTNTTVGNKVASTFTNNTYGTTYTASAIGGDVASTVTIDLEGDVIEIDAPSENQYGVTGFAPLMQQEMQRKQSKKKEEEINKQLDSSEDYAKKIEADALMKARVSSGPPSPPAPGTTKVRRVTQPDGTVWEIIPAVYGGIVDGQWDPNYMVAPAAWTQVGDSPFVTQDEEKFLAKQQTLVNLTKSLNRIGLPNDFAQWTINYAKGNMTPITKFSSGMEREVLELVNKKFEENPNATTVSIQYADYGWGGKSLSTRLGLGRFKATRLPNGDIRITDTFNVDKTFTTIGFADIIPGLQKTADRLVNIAHKRRNIVGVYDEGGIPIDVIIRKRKKEKGGLTDA